MMIEIFCEICNPFPGPIRTKPLGLVDPDNLYLPISGKMFASIDPNHHVPPPFHETWDWELMKCPACPPATAHRPFIKPNFLRTREGLMEVKPRDKVAIAKLLRAEGQTYQEIADFLGVARATVKEWING